MPRVLLQQATTNPRYNGGNPYIDASGNSFSLSFDQSLDASGSSLTSGGFKLYVDGSEQMLYDTDLAFDGSGSAINVNIPSWINLYNDSNVLLAYDSNNGNLQDFNGNQLESFITQVYTSSLTNYRDNTAPTLNSGNPYIDPYGSSFSLSFDEAIDASGSSLNSSAFKLYVDGSEQFIDASGLTFDASGSAINISLPTGIDIYNDSSILLAYDNNNGNLQDAAGNQLESFITEIDTSSVMQTRPADPGTDASGAPAAGETTNPRYNGGNPYIDASGNSFSLTFDQSLDASGSSLTSGGFKLYVDGSEQMLYDTDLAFDGSGSAINVNIPSWINLYNDSNVLLAYDSNNGNLQDFNGNQLESFITQVYTSSLTNYRDNTAPTLNSGNPSIDAYGSSFLLSFDEVIDASGSSLNSSAFKLYVDGSQQFIDASGLTFDASGSAINISLPTGIDIYNDSSILLAYDNNNGNLQDAAGNQLESFITEIDTSSVMQTRPADPGTDASAGSGGSGFSPIYVGSSNYESWNNQLNINLMSGDINTAANTWDIQQNFKVYTDSSYSNEIYNAITSISLSSTEIHLNLDTYNIDNYVGAGSELYVQYDGTNYPNALQDNSGLTVDNLSTNFWYQPSTDSSGGTGGGSGFSPIYVGSSNYESWNNQLNINLMSGDINTAANTWDIQQNFKVYTDSSYSNEIYNAITSISLSSTEIHLNLDTYNIDNYVGAGSELYVQYDSTNYPNALQDNSGLTVDNLSTNFWYQSSTDSSGGTGGGSGYSPIYVGSSNYESWNNQLNINLMSGDINTSANTWDIQQNFKVYTDSSYSNEIYNAITSISLSSTEIHLNLDTYNIDNYVGAGSQLYVQYDGTNYPNALQDNSGLTVDNLSTNFWYQPSTDSSGGSGGGTNSGMLNGSDWPIDQDASSSNSSPAFTNLPLSEISAIEDQSIISLQLENFKASAGSDWEDLNQDLELKITTIPPTESGTLAYLDSDGIEITVLSGDVVTEQQVQGLYFKPASDWHGSVSIGIEASDSYGNALTNVQGIRLLDQAEISSFEIQIQSDLNNDGVIGVTVLDKLADPYYDANGNYNNNVNYDNVRYLYNTSEGLLLSRDSLSAQNDASGGSMDGSGNYYDLRYANNYNDSWNGPSLALLKNDDGSAFNIDQSLSIQSVCTIRGDMDASGGDSVNGFQIVAADDSNLVSVFSFSLDGTLSESKQLEAAEISSFEIKIQSDLNNDGVVGVTVLDKLADPYFDANGNYNNNVNYDNVRYLYNTSEGLLLSRDSLSAQNDASGGYMDGSGNYYDLRYANNDNDSWNGPSLALLKNDDGSAFNIDQSLSIQSVCTIRGDMDASGGDSVNGFQIVAADDSNLVSLFSFSLDGTLSESKQLEAAEISSFEIKIQSDLNNDGVVGVTVLDKLADPYYDANGNYNNNVNYDNVRYLYNTSEGLLLSRDSLSAQNDASGGYMDGSGNYYDLRYANNDNDSWNGPSLALLKNDDGSAFNIDQSLSIQSVCTIRGDMDASGGDSVNGFQIVAADDSNLVSLFSFSLDGTLSESKQLEAAEISSFEIKIQSDLNNDGVVGVTVLDKLADPYYDANGNYNNNVNYDNVRYLYNTSEGLLLSRDSLSAQNDASGGYMDGSGNYYDLRYANNDNDSWNGPSLALLKNDDGSAFNIDQSLSIQSVCTIRGDMDASGGDSVNGFQIVAADASNLVSVFSFSLDGTLSESKQLEAAEISSFEIKIQSDLNNDGVVGVTVLDKLADPYYDANGNYNNNVNYDNVRYLYNTSEGLLLSRDSLSAQNDASGGSMDASGNYYDLRYANNDNDSWNGPSLALLKNDDGSAFNIDQSLSIQSVCTIRGDMDASGGDSVNGFQIVAADDSNLVSLFSFSLDGTLSESKQLEAAEISSFEIKIQSDLNNDGVVGVTVLDKLADPYYDANGNYNNNVNYDNVRYLYNTSEGLLLSRDSLSAQNDASGGYMDGSGNYYDLRYANNDNDSWNGPSLALLKNDDGSAFNIDQSLSIQSVCTIRGDMDASGGDSVNGFQIVAADDSNLVSVFSFSLDGTLSESKQLEAAEISSFEIKIQSDLNNDGVVGVTVLDKLSDPYYGPTGIQTNGNNYNSRFLYSTSEGLVLSKDYLSNAEEQGGYPVDFRYTSNTNTNYAADDSDGPSLLFLKYSNGSPFNVAQGSKDALEVKVLRNEDGGIDGYSIAFIGISGPAEATFNCKGILNDFESSTLESTIDINIRSVNDAPVLASGTLSPFHDINEDTSISIKASDLLIGYNDDSDSASELTISNLATTRGSITASADQEWVFTPEANFNGDVTISFAVTDKDGATTTASHTFKVNAINDAPELSGSNSPLEGGLEDSQISITASQLLAGYTDADGDTLSVSG